MWGLLSPQCFWTTLGQNFLLGTGQYHSSYKEEPWHSLSYCYEIQTYRWQWHFTTIITFALLFYMQSDTKKIKMSCFSHNPYVLSASVILRYYSFKHICFSPTSILEDNWSNSAKISHEKEKSRHDGSKTNTNSTNKKFSLCINPRTIPMCQERSPITWQPLLINSRK